MIVASQHILEPSPGHKANQLGQKDSLQSKLCRCMCRSLSGSIVIESLARLEHCQNLICIFDLKICIPAGSFRCERLVKSSLASSIDGFISGGREGLPSS